MNKNIREQTYRKDKITLTAGTEYKFYLGTDQSRFTRPNHFIINSAINDIVYISDTPGVSSTKYSKKVSGISRQLYAEVSGRTAIYLKSDTGGDVVIESYYAEFTEESISPTFEMLDSGAPGTPVSEVISLTGGTPYTVKATAGWVVAFGSGVTPNTEIRNDLTAVWTGDYIAGHPFYCDTSIVLYCATNNDVTIVYL